MIAEADYPVAGRVYKLRNVERWVKVIRTAINPHNDQPYAWVWLDKHGYTWSGLHLFPLSEIMLSPSRADRN